MLAKRDRLLLVEVKGRGPGALDGEGIAALGPIKRKRLERAWSCWVAVHPERAEDAVEMVAALVPLPPARGAVRWLRLEC